MYTIETTRRLAQLSKISFTDNELLNIHNDMADIVNLMDKIKDAKLTDIFEYSGVGFDALRKDKPEKSYAPSEILMNAKEAQNQSFIVPNLIQDNRKE